MGIHPPSEENAGRKGDYMENGSRREHVTKVNGHYFVAGLCVLSFILAQAFQELAYRFSIPASHGLEDSLRVYRLPVEQAQALAVGATILLLLVPYLVIAMRYFKVVPVPSVLGLIFVAAFVACEISYRKRMGSCLTG